MTELVAFSSWVIILFTFFFFFFYSLESVLNIFNQETLLMVVQEVRKLTQNVASQIWL